MKSFLPVLFALSLLIVACAPAAPGTPAGTADDSITETPEVPTAVQGIIDGTTPKPSTEVDTGKANWELQLSSDVRDLLEKGRSRDASGYGYLYVKRQGGKVSPDAVNNAAVVQRNLVRKATLPNPVQLEKGYFVTSAMYDDDAGAVTLYCRDRRCGWSNGPGVSRDADYASYNFPTPSTWLLSMSSAKQIGEETISSRKTYKLDAVTASGAATIWIDRYTGLPLQVEQGAVTYSYENLVLGVKDEELLP